MLEEGQDPYSPWCLVSGRSRFTESGSPTAVVLMAFPRGHEACSSISRLMARSCSLRLSEGSFKHLRLSVSPWAASGRCAARARCQALDGYEYVAWEA